MKTEIRSKSAPNPVGPYSQAIDAGAVYCAGQLGIDPSTGELVQGISAQTGRVLRNIEGVLREAGLGLKNVVKTTVFLADMAEYAAMNEEYAKHFTAPYPARSTVQAAALPRGARVEIDAIAVR
jgi:2-iminobutanoate/2-iminopropanoate deaminase